MARSLAFLAPILLAACAATTSPTASTSSIGSNVASPTALPASPTPSALPSIPLSETYSIWHRVEMPDPTPHVYGGEWAADIVAFNGGFVAVGFINGGCCDGGFTTDTRAVVWTSPDGASWQLEPDVPAFALSHMVAAATDGRRIVAVGFRNVESTAFPGSAEPRRATWVSTDGTTWTAEFNDLQPFYSIAFHDGRFRAAVAYGDAGPEIWSSADGTSWTRDAGAETLGPGKLNLLRETELGLVAAGFTDGPPAQDGSYTQVAVTWLSDGKGRWQRSPDQAALQNAHIDDLAAIDGRLVAIGGNWDTEGGVSWMSDDGLTWTPIDDPALAADCGIPNRLIAVSDGLLAIGATCADAQFRAWTSPDGSRWSVGSASQPGQQHFGPQVQGWLIRPDSSLLAVGYGAASDDPSHVAPMAWLVDP